MMFDAGGHDAVRGKEEGLRVSGLEGIREPREQRQGFFWKHK